MGKSKKKKNQFKDFQKVKLKVGKKLPRGLNETVATFNTRSIQMKEQLKATLDDQPTTKRKLNITDLLGQCQHYNITVRHEAVMGIKELITTHPQTLDKYIGPILERCSELFTDKDRVVRSGVHKLLGYAIPKVSSNTIAAFFSVMSAHLCCAMTHIEEDIQHDSLLIIDLFLDNFPGLVVNGNSAIVSNFMEQISRQTQVNAKGAPKDRSLLVNPNSKISSQKWRNKVLERLKKFFMAFLKYSTNNNSNMTGLTAEIAPLQQVIFDELRKPMNRVELLKHTGAVLDTSRDRTQADDRGNSREFNLQNFVEMLVPLLLQCWVEAGPSQLATDLPGNVLSNEAVTTLWNVLGVLQLLMQIMDKQNDSKFNIQWFGGKHLSNIIHYFMPHFPYSMHERAAVRKNQKNKHGKGAAHNKNSPEAQVSIRSLNLSVCKILSYYMGKTSINKSVGSKSTKNDWQDNIFDYITGVLPMYNLSSDQVCIVVEIAEKVVDVCDNPDYVSGLLEVAYKIYKSSCKHTSYMCSEVTALLRFFSKVAFVKQSLKNERYPILTPWLESLPSLVPWILKRDVPNLALLTEVLQYLKCAGPLGNQQFLKNLKNMLMETAFDGEKTEWLTKLDLDQQKRLLELVYWVDTFTQTDTQQIAGFCKTSAVDKKVIYHLLEVLCFRMGKHIEGDYCDRNSKTELQESDRTGNMHRDTAIADHISLLLSLIVEKKDATPKASDKLSMSKRSSKITTGENLSLKECEFRLFLIECSSDILVSFTSTHNLSAVIVTFLQKYLLEDQDAVCKISLLAAVGVLHIWSKMLKSENHQGDCQLSDRHNYKMMQDIIFDLIPRNLDQEDVALIPGNREREDFATMPESNKKERNTSDSKQNNPSEISSMDTSEKDHPDTCSSLMVSGLGKAVERMLWDKCVECVKQVPELCDGFMRRFCDKLLTGGAIEDEEWFMLDCVTTSKLLSHNGVQKNLSSRTKSQLHQTVKTISESYPYLMQEEWWVMLKYEVSVLSNLLSVE